jgi:ribosome recycling factor
VVKEILLRKYAAKYLKDCLKCFFYFQKSILFAKPKHIVMLNVELKEVLERLKANLDKNINHTKNEFSRIRAGKASPEMLEGVLVEYYGNPTPLNQVANISAPEARTLAVQPFERGLIQEIEKAIINANLGFAPQNDGHLVRITIPPLTDERRRQLVKTAKMESENSKIGARTLRKEANEKIKRLQKEGVAEDEAKEAESMVQKLIDTYTEEIDKLLVEKEKDILTI